MEYIITALVSLAVAMLSWALQSLLKENHRLKKNAEETHQQEYTALKNGVTCILRNLLIEMHQKYTDIGKISIHGLQNWQTMYKAYKALGGNGMVDHMNDDIEALPIQ